MRELLGFEFLGNHQDLGITLTIVRELGETVYVEGLLEGMRPASLGLGRGPVPTWSPQ